VSRLVNATPAKQCDRTLRAGQFEAYGMPRFGAPSSAGRRNSKRTTWARQFSSRRNKRLKEIATCGAAGTAKFARSQIADHLHQIPDLTLRRRFAAFEVLRYAETVEERQHNIGDHTRVQSRLFRLDVFY